MKKMTKRMILSVITLVLVVVALGTTTFAWFTLSTTATVSDITGTVQAGEGLEVGLSFNANADSPTTGFLTNITTTDWVKVYGIDKEIKSDVFSFGAISLNGVGTAFTTMILKVDQSDAPAGKTILEQETTMPAANAKGSYLQFSVHFKSDSEGAIKWSGYDFAKGTSYAFQPGVTFTDAQGVSNAGTTVTINAQNAARIGIYNADGTTLTKAVQKPSGAHGTNGDVYVNVVNAKHGSNETAIGQVAGQFSYLTAKGNIIYWPSAIVTNPETVEFYNAAVETEDVVVANIIAGGGTAKVVVKVWLEGWDADMYDAMFRSILDFSLTFYKD